MREEEESDHPKQRTEPLPSPPSPRASTLSLLPPRCLPIKLMHWTKSIAYDSGEVGDVEEPPTACMRGPVRARRPFDEICPIWTFDKGSGGEQIIGYSGLP